MTKIGMFISQLDCSNINIDQFVKSSEHRQITNNCYQTNCEIFRDVLLKSNAVINCDEMRNKNTKFQ